MNERSATRDPRSWWSRTILGPLAAPSRAGRLLGLGVVLILTLLSQAGGVFVWPALGIATGVPRHRRLAAIGLGLGAYAIGCAVLIPPLAALGGRVPLPVVARDGLGPRSFFFCALNRHYVERDVREELVRIARSLDETDQRPLRYLDASFPFALPLPMLPHFSHGPGRAVDLAMPLLDPATGRPIDGGGSPIGYWGYVELESGEFHATPPTWLDLRWDFTWLQPAIGNTRLDAPRLADLIDALLEAGTVEKVLVEPRIEHRLVRLASRPERARDLLGYQGDLWARHDDHVHLRFEDR